MKWHDFGMGQLPAFCTTSSGFTLALYSAPFFSYISVDANWSNKTGSKTITTESAAAVPYSQYRYRCVAGDRILVPVLWNGHLALDTTVPDCGGTGDC